MWKAEQSLEQLARASRPLPCAGSQSSVCELCGALHCGMRKPRQLLFSFAPLALTGVLPSSTAVCCRDWQLQPEWSGVGRSVSSVLNPAHPTLKGPGHWSVRESWGGLGRKGLRGGIGAPHLQGGGAWLPFSLMPALTDPNPARALKVKSKECLSCSAP